MIRMDDKNIRCFYPGCPFKAETIEELLEHLKGHRESFGLKPPDDVFSTAKLRPMFFKENEKLVKQKREDLVWDLVDKNDFTETKNPPPIRKKPRAPVETEETILKGLLEQGEYEKALDLDGKTKPSAIKSKIIEYREEYPSLSSVLQEAEDALLKNHEEYYKNLEVKKDLAKQVSKKYGEGAVELFPNDLLWRLINERVMSSHALASHVMQQIEEIAAKLPSIGQKVNGKVNIYFYEKGCPDCKDNPPNCPECSGSGQITRYLRGGDIFKEAERNPELKKFLKQKGIKKTDLKKSIFDMAFGPTVTDSIFEDKEYEVTVAEPCPTCYGSGKYCNCIHNVSFEIPENTSVGTILKGKELETNRAFFARMGK